MKRASEILKQMGFRKDAPEGLKEAFVRHLIKSATGVEVAPGPNEIRDQKIQKALLRTPVQLEFNLEESHLKKVEVFDAELSRMKKKSS